MDNPLAVARYLPLYQIGVVPRIQSQVSSTTTAASSSCHCCLWKRTTEQVGLSLLIPWPTNQRPAQVPRAASADQVSGRRCQGGEDQRQQDEAEGADEEDGGAGRHAEREAHPHTAVRKSSSKGRGWKVGDLSTHNQISINFRIILRNCSYFNSNAFPLKLVLNSAEEEGGVIKAIYKVGDDLRQDMLTLQV